MRLNGRSCFTGHANARMGDAPPLLGVAMLLHPSAGAVSSRMTNRRPPARPADTTAAADAVQVALFRAASVERRLRCGFGFSASIISAARRGLSSARPGASLRDIDLWFVELHYGADLAAGLRAHLEERDRAAAAGD